MGRMLQIAPVTFGYLLTPLPEPSGEPPTLSVLFCNIEVGEQKTKAQEHKENHNRAPKVFLYVHGFEQVLSIHNGKAGVDFVFMKVVFVSGSFSASAISVTHFEFFSFETYVVLSLSI